MTLVRVFLIGAFAVVWAGAAGASPVTIELVASETFDAQFPSYITWDPALPMSGTGDIDEAAGTYSVNLPDFSVTVDILTDGAADIEVATTNWGQDGTFAGGLGGAISGSSSTGTVVCTVLGGVGSAVCPNILPTVPSWPVTGDPGATLGAPSASIDIDAKTITIVHGLDPTGGGQVRNTYSYAHAPPMIPVIGPLGASVLTSLILGSALVLRRRSRR